MAVFNEVFEFKKPDLSLIMGLTVQAQKIYST